VLVIIEANVCVEKESNVCVEKESNMLWFCCGCLLSWVQFIRDCVLRQRK